jgi:hypothetical protein
MPPYTDGRPWKRRRHLPTALATRQRSSHRDGPFGSGRGRQVGLIAATKTKVAKDHPCRSRLGAACGNPACIALTYLSASPAESSAPPLSRSYHLRLW